MSTATIILPPLEALDAAAATLLTTATPSQERALNKALWRCQSGIEIRSTCGGFLIPSGTRAGVIHRISTVHGCNCEAALKGGSCWHAQSIRILEEAQRHTMPALPSATAWPPHARPKPRWPNCSPKSPNLSPAGAFSPLPRLEHAMKYALTSLIVRWSVSLMVLLAVVAIAASALDLHCGAVRPASDTVVLACRAGRLP